MNRCFVTSHYLLSELGGAIANLDAIYLKLQIPSLAVKIITYGQPRVREPLDSEFPYSCILAGRESSIC